LYRQEEEYQKAAAKTKYWMDKVTKDSSGARESYQEPEQWVKVVRLSCNQKQEITKGDKPIEGEWRRRISREKEEEARNLGPIAVNVEG
jgi:hypothetical protein